MSTILALHVNDKDTCVTVTAPVEPGDEVSFIEAGEKKTIIAKDKIPIYHKIATKDHAEGELIYKYGYKIAIATKPIEIGQHVHIHNVRPAGMIGTVEHSSAELST